tara:strand:- start:478 stop:1449 length:972 start_codon:yes stop_codon:yes gene_type:complete
MILITGLNGEMGSALVQKLNELGKNNIIGLDIKPIKESLKPFVTKHYVGDIKDKNLIKKIFTDNKLNEVYHLAAILSTKAEASPFLSHQINVDGFLNLLAEIENYNSLVKFFFASSIAVYHLNENKNIEISENEFCNPSNMYGCNKLYCEKIGSYFSKYSKNMNNLDFRSIRFSGIISAQTLPVGGTSDYAPEMIHSAIRNKNYTCFVNSESCIPFMIMPDAIEGIIKLMDTDKSRLKHDVYHIQSFSPTVEMIYQKLKLSFPKFKLNYDINKRRQFLINSWPNKLNQSAAVEDWDWSPKFDFDKSFDEYLIPIIADYYAEKK